LLGTPNTLALDAAVLVVALVVALGAAAALLPRLAR
jgi:hypothetical protein